MEPRPRARPDKPASLRDRFAIFAAWLSFVSYILAIGHYSLVEHASCAEHGELVHASHDHASHDHAAHDHGTEAWSRLHDLSDVRSSFVASSEDDHEHDHCLVCADRREVVFSFFAVREVDPPEVRAEITFERPASIDVVRDICAFAPKTSPPQAFA